MIAKWAWHLYAWRRNPAWRDRLAAIRRIRALDPSAFTAWQTDAIREHVAWARATIPYWHARIGTVEGLEDLPILTRRDVQQHADALRDPTRPVSALREDASGGSTGEPVRLWHDEDYATWTFATEVHVMETWGLEPWCRLVVLWGSDRDLKEIPWRERLWIRLKDDHILNAFRMGDDDLARYAETLARRQPAYVLGYASALDLLAAHVLEHAPSRPIRPRVIRSSAEVLTPAARARIEAAFGCAVYDYYGSRESACLAAQCPAGNLHVQAHGRALELVDDAGAPVPPGTPGRVLVTDLTNRAFGLLRYETGDVATWDAPEPCACGLPSTLR